MASAAMKENEMGWIRRPRDRIPQLLSAERYLKVQPIKRCTDAIKLHHEDAILVQSSVVFAKWCTCAWTNERARGQVKVEKYGVGNRPVLLLFGKLWNLNQLKLFKRKLNNRYWMTKRTCERNVLKLLWCHNPMNNLQACMYKFVIRVFFKDTWSH